jgi:hypothetical protein
MRRLFLLAVMVLAVFATAKTNGSKVDGPLPDCNPCPFVR